MIDAPRGASRRILSILVLPLLVVASACGGSGDEGPCTTCPPPPPSTGTLSLEVGYEAASDLAPAGFKASDVVRVDVVVVGPNGQETRSLSAPTNRAAFELDPGQYSVSATSFGTNNLILFTDATEATVVAGQTAEVDLVMQAALGTVTLAIDGQTSGSVDAVAGEGVPFTVTVRNNQGSPVPGSTVRLTPTTAEYGRVAFDGTDETNAQGQASGTINAAFSGELSLTLTVDGRPIANPGATRVVFATGVSAENSAITNSVLSGPRLNGSAIANGQSVYEYTVVVRDAEGAPLPGVPVTPRSVRNAGLDPDVDLIEPANGFEDGVTSATGEFRFTVRTFSSSFLALNGDGRLRSTDGSFVPVVIEVVADGVLFDQATEIWNSPVHPNLGALNTTKQFVTANGQDSATIIVNAEALPDAGGGPVANSFVELVTATGDVLNQELDITPEQGFDGFRTNAQGEWRGTIRSTEPGALFFGVKVDGRALILDSLRSLIFQ